MSTISVSGALGGQKWVLDPLELELQLATNWELNQGLLQVLILELGCLDLYLGSDTVYLDNIQQMT